MSVIETDARLGDIVIVEQFPLFKGIPEYALTSMETGILEYVGTNHIFLASRFREDNQSFTGAKRYSLHPERMHSVKTIANIGDKIYSEYDANDLAVGDLVLISERKKTTPVEFTVGFVHEMDPSNLLVKNYAHWGGRRPWWNTRETSISLDGSSEYVVKILTKQKDF